MKILHVIPSVGPLRGGPSVVIRSLTRGLTLRGVEVHVCTTDDNGRDRTQICAKQAITEDGVTFFYFPRQLVFYTVSLPLAKWLRRNAGNYDLIHIHGVFSFSSTVAAFIARARGVPYVVRPLGVLNEWGIKNRRTRVKRLSLRFIEKHMFAGASLVHFTSEQERIEAQKAGVNGPSIVIPNPVPEAENFRVSSGEFRRMHPELAGKRIVLFLSRLDRKKGLELLLEAHAKLHLASVSLVIAGDGDESYREELERLAGSLGLTSNVCWTGFLTGSAKAAAFAAADLFVLPSYSENFGNAVAEALCAGVPTIISNRVGIWRELSQRNAALVVSCNSNAICSAMSHLLSSPDAAAEMAIQGQRAVRELFSENSVIEKLLNCYREILVGNPRRLSEGNKTVFAAIRSH